MRKRSVNIVEYFRTCPHCGAHLDPSESCDCLESLRDRAKAEIMSLTREERHLLLKSWKLHLQFPELSIEESIKLAASGAGNTESGRAEQVLTGLNSASIIPTMKGGRQV